MEINPTPARPPAFDPQDARFWDPDDLDGELRRVIEICHGCRMCVGYCPTFPFVFDRIDESHERRAMAHSALSLDAADLVRATDLCFQCKLCHLKCPYTPDDPASGWMVDLPRLLWREKVVRTRREGGVSLQESLLGEPGLLGALSSGAAAPIANFVSASRLARKALERVAGVSAEFPLPMYASEPFARWLARHIPASTAGERGRVALFATCLVDYHRPSTGEAAVRVLELVGFAVERPPQACCGMPNMDTGDLQGAVDKARENVAALAPLVRAGRAVVVPGPSCSMQIRREYPELLGSDDARLVAANTFDLMEFLWARWREGALPRAAERPLGSVAYHAPCHLRAQRVGFPARSLLERAGEAEVTLIEQCSAVDGTWGMRSEFYELGVKYARKLTRGVDDVGARWVASDCPLASQRIAKECGVTVSHPVELLAYAYGLIDVPGGASVAPAE